MKIVTKIRYKKDLKSHIVVVREISSTKTCLSHVYVAVIYQVLTVAILLLCFDAVIPSTIPYFIKL